MFIFKNEQQSKNIKYLKSNYAKIGHIKLEDWHIVNCHLYND